MFKVRSLYEKPDVSVQLTFSCITCLAPECSRRCMPCQLHAIEIHFLDMGSRPGLCGCVCAFTLWRFLRCFNYDLGFAQLGGSCEQQKLETVAYLIHENSWKKLSRHLFSAPMDSSTYFFMGCLRFQEIPGCRTIS